MTKTNDFLNTDIAIIGCGIVGATLANILAESGHNITIIDRAGSVKERIAANNNAIIMPLISHKNDTIGEFYTAGFYQTLAHIKQYNNIFKECGVIDIKDIYQTTELSNLAIKAGSAEKISYQNFTGLFIKEAGVIDTSKLITSLLEQYKEQIRVVFDSNILEIKYENISNESGLWKIISAQQNLNLKAKIVIIANSYDALNFSQTSWLPLEKIRGQISFYPEIKKPKIEQVICMNGYITPAQEGYHHIGATYVRNVNNTELSVGEHEQNLMLLKRLFDFDIDQSNINYTELKGQIGFRSATFDRRPIVGEVPNLENFVPHYKSNIEEIKNYPNLYLSVAHGSRGLTSCVLTAKYLSELIIAKENLKTTKELLQLEKLLAARRFIIKKINQMKKN